MRSGVPDGVKLPAVLNPLRSEQEAFRFLIYVAVVFGVIIAIVLIARAL
jgi:hypothetical protein